MRKIVILFILLIPGLNSTGQTNKYGVPLVKNYMTQLTPGSEQNWCITKDNFGNIYLGSQDRGVTRYDGTKWTSIKIGKNPRIYSLESDSRGIVYVGAAFEFGYLQPDKRGNTEYISLASRLDSISEIKVVYSIVIENGKVLFLSPKFVYIYDIVRDSLSKINLLKYKLIDALRLVKVNDKLIIADNFGGLFELNDTVITQLPGGEFFKNKNCLVFLPYDHNRVLIGTFYDGVFLYDYKTGDVNSNFIDHNINEKLKQVSVYAGAMIKSGLYAFGTTNQEGILIFNHSGKLVQQIRKENSALEDNTIYSMYCDYMNDGELWFSTLGYINKAYTNLPLTEFGDKQGIGSGVNKISNFHGDLYLSSDAGILKSYTDEQNGTGFKKIEGINTQVFPLEIIKSEEGNILLAGSLNALLELSAKGKISNVEKNCTGLPVKYPIVFNVKKILQSSNDRSIVYLGLDAGGMVFLRFNGDHWSFINRDKKIPGVISGIVEKKEGGLWILTDDPVALYSMEISGKDTLVLKYGRDKGVPDIDINSINSFNNDIYLTTGNGMLKYLVPEDKFIPDDSLTGGYSFHKSCQGIYPDSDGDIWFSGIDKNRIEMLFRKTKEGYIGYSGVLSLLPNVALMDIMYLDGKIFLLKSKTVYVLDKAGLIPDTTTVNSFFVRILAGSDSVVMQRTFFKTIEKGKRIPQHSQIIGEVPEYGFDMNEISFEWTTPYYTEELLTEYSYKLDGFDKEWSAWEGISYGNTMEAQYSKRKYTNLPYGHYIFRVRAKTLTGLKGNELSYEFVILKPWYATIAALLGFIIIALIIIYLVIKAYTKKLINENIRLEGIVAERTAVVVKQKEELESSIHYASRIQMALLPSEAILKENIKNYFVLFKPRDIVSGDFYWMTRKGDRLYIVAADCTGHGVPGAFMSLLGMSFLDEIIDKDSAPKANIILNELRLHVTESLKQVGDDDEAKDGMDIAILVIDFKTKMMEYSGAYNPCFKVRKLNEDDDINNQNSASKRAGFMSNGKYLLETIYASKMPIGISLKMDESFVFNEWPIEQVFHIIFFQMVTRINLGDLHGRKFMKKAFKEFILSIQDYPMDKQKELIDNNLKEWMGSTPQIDDILVMGIKT